MNKLYRITPAGAGKTVSARSSLAKNEDHPRRCGENGLAFSHVFLILGSPPQVRGKLAGTAIGSIAGRITPAGAGKTGTVGVSAVGIEDHPRRCGENYKPSVPSPVDRGSPPQVRGKRIRTKFSADSSGITPAGAGKTTITYGGIAVATDHPRRCGENLLIETNTDRQKGSPPQVRGKLV